jgi:hypothetical protein
VDRRNRHRLIYRVDTISAADSGGARRNWARRRRGDAVARGSARGKTTRVSERGCDRSGWPSRWSGSTRRLAPTGGPRLAEREVRGRGFNQKFKKQKLN